MHKESTGLRLIGTSRKFKVVLESGMAGGFSASQCCILGYLRSNDDECEQKDIERAFRLTRPAVSQLIDHMQEAGLVERVVHESDRRCRLIRITDKGRKASDDGCQELRRFDEEVFSVLSAEELESFKQMLDRIYSKLEDMCD